MHIPMPDIIIYTNYGFLVILSNKNTELYFFEILLLNISQRFKSLYNQHMPKRYDCISEDIF